MSFHPNRAYFDQLNSSSILSSPSSGVDAGIHLLVLHLLGREHGLVVHDAPDYEHDDHDSGGGGGGDTYMSA